MGLMTAIVGVGAVAAGVGAVKGAQAAKQSAKYQRQANEFQQKQANLQNYRAKREAVRTSRIALAQAQNSSVNAGVSDSSGAQGGQSSMVSQTIDTQSFLDQYGFYSDQASQALGRANKAAARADMWGSVSNLGFQAMGSSATISGAFTGPKPPQG